MDVHFDAGDIIIVKNVENAFTLEDGEIISFMSTNSDNYGETVTHMIREKTYDDKGEFLGYITYGTNTGVNDENPVAPEYILGVYAGKLPKVGAFFTFLRTTPGYIVCILVPFLLLIGYNGLNCIRLFRQYKKEQTAEIQAERDQIEAERQQNAEMFKELLALKEQLAKQQNGNVVSAEDTPSESPAEVFDDMANTTESTLEETVSENTDEV